RARHHFQKRTHYRLQAVELGSDPERAAARVSAAVAAGDALRAVVLSHEARAKQVPHSPRGRDELFVTGERKDGNLNWRQLRHQTEDYALLAAHLLLGVSVDEEREEAAVDAHRRLDDVGNDLLVRRLVEAAECAAGVLFVLL